MTGCLLSAFRNLVGPGLLFIIGAFLIVNKTRLDSVGSVILMVVAVLTAGAGLLVPASGEKGSMTRGTYVMLVLGAAVGCLLLSHFVAPMVF